MPEKKKLSHPQMGLLPLLKTTAKTLEQHGLVSGCHLNMVVGNHKESLFLLSFTMLCITNM